LNDYNGQSPAAPNKPLGHFIGRIGRYYWFLTRTSDPEGDMVYYQFDWNDGNASSWIGPYKSGKYALYANAWQHPGSYYIQVKSKDAYGVESAWSSPKLIWIRKPIFN
jgi:hypothetical protein